MKLRWKDHELFFITVLAIAQVIADLTALYAPKFSNFAYPESRLGGNVLRNILMPQMGSVLLLYGTYLAIVFLIMPLIRRIRFTDIATVFSRATVKLIASICTLSFLLALGINTLGFYAQPWKYNYAGFGILALFGYNDEPLANIFTGTGRALVFVSIVSLIICIREFISWLIIRKENGREFRIMVVNNITALMLLYFVVLVLINPSNYSFRIYIAYVTPILAIYIYLTFGLFPKAPDFSFSDRKVWLRIFIASIICIIPSFVFLGESNNAFQKIIYWLIIVFLVVPLTLFLFRQRGDQIMQLRGMQTALARSSADLQHLRAQINPHFLFNALNTLYGTSLMEKADKTAEGIQRLGDMMRFMLHENTRDFISMEKELDYLRNYLALQKLRTAVSPFVRIDDNLDEVKCKAGIAPMLLIPFVENAFKHGISLQTESWIRIQLQCSGNEIEFEVANSIHKISENDPERDISGIGLKNVTERLKLLYPGKHNLHISKTDNEYVVKLNLY
ncbi:sensor histidine kinase [Pollutibacter soli]|uniref:sensor histidine kinase n=1 Tax=Pollutibacter soli TaxID=3034157 RepID=UPI003013786F